MNKIEVSIGVEVNEFGLVKNLNESSNAKTEAEAEFDPWAIVELEDDSKPWPGKSLLITTLDF